MTTMHAAKGSVTDGAGDHVVHLPSALDGEIEQKVAEHQAKERRRIRTIRILQVATVLALLAYWQANASSLVSSPQDVGSVLGEWSTDQEMWHHLWVTLQEAVLGYLLGCALGVVSALLLFSSSRALSFVSPFIAALNAVPKIALAPVFIFLFGLGMSSKVYFVVSTTFFLSFWSLVAGLRSIDPIYRNNARVLGADRRWLLLDVYLPAAFGWLMTSLRISLSWALIAAVVGEYLGAVEGIGTVVSQAQFALRQDRVIAGLLVVAIVGFVLDRGLARVERRFARWKL